MPLLVRHQKLEHGDEPQEHSRRRREGKRSHTHRDLGRRFLAGVMHETSNNYCHSAIFRLQTPEQPKRATSCSRKGRTTHSTDTGFQPSKPNAEGKQEGNVMKASRSDSRVKAAGFRQLQIIVSRAPFSLIPSKKAAYNSGTTTLPFSEV